MPIPVKKLVEKYDKGCEYFLDYVDTLHKSCASDEKSMKEIKGNLIKMLSQRPNSDIKLIEYVYNKAPVDFRYFKYYAAIILGEKDHVLSDFFKSILIDTDVGLLLNQNAPLVRLKIARYIFGAYHRSLTVNEKEKAIDLKDDLSKWMILLPVKQDKLAIQLIKTALDINTPLGQILDTQRGFFSKSLFSNEKSCRKSLQENLAIRTMRTEYKESCKKYIETHGCQFFFAREIEHDQESTLSFFAENQKNSASCSLKRNG